MKSKIKHIVVHILLAESRAVIRKYKPTIIGVTGSVGKTSTKDAIYTLLAPHTHVRKSEKSFNSEIGVPLTILGCENGWNSPTLWLKNIFWGLELICTKKEYPKCLILEIGADHPGDIKSLTSWLKPDIAVITAVSKIPVHVEFFSSPKEVLNEKLELARAVKSTGKLVLPAEDADILAVRNETPELGKIPCVTFAIDSSADVSISDYAISYSSTDATPTGMSFKINSEGNSIPTRIDGVLGKQPLYSMVAALATARAYGISISSLISTIPTHKAPVGRMNIIPGLNSSTLIDDTYNASPDAVLEALTVLENVKRETPESRKVAALGDMMELGSYSLEQHKNVGMKVAKIFSKKETSGNDLLVTVGIRARDIAVGAHEAGLALENIKSFDTSLEAGEYMKSVIKKGDTILIKGSQSSRMERVTKALLAESQKDRALELLVRQDPEWQVR